ncbi:translation initiation factor IF-2 subunit gamma [Candidatus Woesearchaeota archaeon]|nr:translation initiation factor IF-2 subunit gamma [Candidatus Woesearchaeota archaeon]
MPTKKNSITDGQPVVNIGLIGHVDHGKTTLTERLSGKWTDTHSEELKRGITIKLGYADTIICKDKDGRFTVETKGTEPVRKISFIDAPGHESLMATMISGANIMDGALLLIAANEECPQPQTREHLMTLEISGIKNLVVVQNKIDLVSEEGAKKSYKEIKEFLKGTSYEDAPIIPVSAKININMDILLEAIEEYIPTPDRKSLDKEDPIMFIARSFDINKPGSHPDDLVGGILGGSVKQGRFKNGEEVEILPGRAIEDKNQRKWIPITTKITGMKTGGKNVTELRPGGSVAMMTALDPSLVKSDSLTGNIVGKKGKMPPVWYELNMELNLLDRVIGAKESTAVDPIKMSEMLMLNVNSAATVGVVTNLKKNKIHCRLHLPVCADPGSRVTISRRVGNRFRLIGYGVIQ